MKEATVHRDEAPAAEEVRAPTCAAYVLPLSAGSRAALKRRARDVGDVLGKLPEGAEGSGLLSAFCYTASARGSHGKHRLAAVGASVQQLRQGLTDFAHGRETPVVTAGKGDLKRASKLVFVFPGHGSQWVGMGRDLLSSSSTFRRSMERISEAIEKETGWSVLARLEDTSLKGRLTRIEVVQPMLFAMHVALAQLWLSWGIVPDVVIGHSMGEVAAATIAGILTIEDAAKVICREAALLTRVAGAGAMLVVDVSPSEAQQLMAGREDQVAIAVCNSSRSTVLAGDSSVLDQLAKELRRGDIFHRRVRLEVAAHCAQMDPLLGEFASLLEDVSPRSGSIPLCSTVRACMLDGGQMGGAYWVENLRQPVLFSAGINMLLAEGFAMFLEVSPHPILIPFLEQNAKESGRPALVLESLRREKPEMSALLSSLGTLYASGQAVDWGGFYAGCDLAPLPPGPWGDEQLWTDSAEASRADLESEEGQSREDGPTSVAFGDALAHHGGDLLQSLLRLDPGERQRALTAWMREQTASVLRVEVDAVPVETPFQSLGLDSLTALELRNRMERHLELKLSATLAWNYPTIASMAAYLGDRVTATRAAKTVAVCTSVSSTASTPAVRSATPDPRRSSGMSAAEELEAELMDFEGLQGSLGG